MILVEVRMASKIGRAFDKLSRKRSSRAEKKWRQGQYVSKAKKHTETPIKMVPIGHHHVFSKRITSKPVRPFDDTFSAVDLLKDTFNLGVKE